MCISVIGRSSVGVPTYQNVKTSRPQIFISFFFPPTCYVCLFLLCFCLFLISRDIHKQVHCQMFSFLSIHFKIFRRDRAFFKCFVFVFLFKSGNLCKKKILHSRQVSQRGSCSLFLSHTHTWYYVYVYC